jgi:hypothetical protein
VWLAAQRMNTALAGATLLRGEFRIPQLATADLTGATVREVVARGKHLLIRLADGRTLRTHFRMDGSWHIYRPGTKWHGGPAYDVRMVLATPEWECVGYRLHDIDLIPTAEEDRLVGHLGPDVLGPDWDLDEALRRLRSSTNATWPESATSTRSRRCSSSASTRGCGSPMSSACRLWSSAAARSCGPTCTTPSRTPPAIRAAAATTGCSAVAGSPASAAAPRSCSASRGHTCRSG